MAVIPMPAGSLVALEGVSVRFGAQTALDGVDFAVRRGEIVALVGANGSGKTTLLRLLHGVVAHAGERRIAPGLRHAMVYQRPFLLHLSALRNLQIGLWLADRAAARESRGELASARGTTPPPSSSDERRERARAALARVGLEALASRSARALSGGEQQRLALARGWATKPELLLLDEPTSSLDPAARVDVEALLAGFAADGMTLVFSTHDLAQARRLATRIVHLEGGRIDADLATADFVRAAAEGGLDPFLSGELAWSRTR
jgi:tungstate transport system ATP-binding protein